jgi:hypothetical protein
VLDNVDAELKDDPDKRLVALAERARHTKEIVLSETSSES